MKSNSHEKACRVYTEAMHEADDDKLPLWCVECESQEQPGKTPPLHRCEGPRVAGVMDSISVDVVLLALNRSHPQLAITT
jgi:hypothetical protein